MPSTFNIFLIAALLCVVLLLVLTSLLRTGTPGVREWVAANVLGIMAFILYAFGRELPPFVAYEVANGVYAAASAAILAGFYRFFGRRIRWALVAGGIAALMIAIAIFHYGFYSFGLRTTAVSTFQVAVSLGITLVVLQSRGTWRSRYPYIFTAGMAMIVAFGHAVRGAVYLSNPVELTSLLQPSFWNLVFLSAGTTVLPMLTFGAVMMVHDRMMARAEHAANRDFLTGAWSRRAFIEIAERELARVSRTGQKLSLLILDIDNFKLINDTAGHAAGDRVLVDVVLRAETVTRNVDYFARIGGEEFAMLLPSTDLGSAIVAAERLRGTLENRPAGESGTPAYTVSIGLAELRDGESFHELMRRADASLYQAKGSGRNLVVASQA